MEMTQYQQKPIKIVNEYTSKVVKFNDRIQKTLRFKGVVPNALILNEMNFLIMKH
jgi:hypothetical protein